MEKIFRVLLKRNATCLSCGDEPSLSLRAKFYLNCHSTVTSYHYLTIPIVKSMPTLFQYKMSLKGGVDSNTR